MGLENALSEITLVLFTSLAPSGAVAIAIVAAVLAFARLDDGVRAKMNVFLCVPLIVTMVGLVASATHLGNPANALYVFMGVGRSPLSNEVFSAVVFLGLTGVYWLYSFSLRPNRALQRMWLCAIAVFAAAFVFFVGQAYSAETVITWDTAYGPAGIVCTALLGGPLLAVVTLRLAGWASAAAAFGKALAVVSAVALACGVACFVAQGIAVLDMGNHIISVRELVPAYWPMVVAFAVLGAVGVGVFAGVAVDKIRYQLPVAVVALACLFVGIFVMRFAFYMMHLTVGVGV